VFGRSHNPEPKFPGALGTSPETTPPRPPAPTGFVPAPGSRPVSIIGSDLAIVGQKITLVCQSTLMVIGEVNGDINGDDVTIGDTGKVTGTITARSITVHGKVKGALRGETIALHSTAHIEGDVVQKNLIIAEGAKFDGRVRVAKDASEIKPVLDAAAVAAATVAG
jgi:cytoskeletal protein CcmA (bactofilin family)